MKTSSKSKAKARSPEEQAAKEAKLRQRQLEDARRLGNFDALPASAHVRLPIVCGLLGFGPATCWRYVKSGMIPAPKKIGPRIAAWNVGELRAALLTIAA